jgi:GlcNAc-PI de-N-acetylase
MSSGAMLPACIGWCSEVTDSEQWQMGFGSEAQKTIPVGRFLVQVVRNVFFWMAGLGIALVPVAHAQDVGKSFRAGPSLSGLTYMQILAHEDDDILFMNPDMANEIADGVTTISVYLTAGQSCGVGNCSLPPTDGECPADYMPDKTPPTTCLYPGDSAPPLILTREEFAAARQGGIRAAYAQMAGVPNIWTRTLIQPDGNYTVELFTLLSAPRIHLVFMDLPDGGDTIAPNNYALTSLYGDPSSYLAGVIVPLCDENTISVLSMQSPIPGPLGYCESAYNDPPMPLQIYDRAGIVSVLSALLQLYQPIEVRTLDPHPFQKLTSSIVACTNNGELLTCNTSGYDVNYDNSDHTATALFVDEVLANYHGPNGSGRYSVDHYKGYSSPDFPANLGDADHDSKSATVFTYIPYDPNFVTYQDLYPPYYDRVWERYPGSTNWLQSAGDGRMVAASVEDSRVKIWYESAPGGPWVGPVSIWTGAPISPHITLLQRPDGLLQIFALRLPLVMPAVNTPLQDIVTAVEVPARFPDAHSPLSPITFGPWQSAGSPDGACADPGCQYVGPPTAAIDGNGRTFIFAKNSLGLLSYTVSPGGTQCIEARNASCAAWSPWDSESLYTQTQPLVVAITQAADVDIIDGIATITRDDGRIETFASRRTGKMLHYIQDPNSTHFTYDVSFSSLEVASAPTVTKNQDGRLEIFYREAADSTTGAPGARVMTLYQSGGVWHGPVVLYGDAGAGPVAAIRRAGTGEIMLFERNVWYGISETNQVAPNSNFSLQWTILGGQLNEYPAAATDKFGRTMVVVKGLDGNLYMRRELSPTLGGNFGPWVLLGGTSPLPIRQRHNRRLGE